MSAERFAFASAWVADKKRAELVPIKLSNDKQLTLYKWYKQSQDGDNTQKAPWAFKVQAHAKWSAWTEAKGTPSEEAMDNYANEVLEVAQNISTNTLTSEGAALVEECLQRLTKSQPVASPVPGTVFADYKMTPDLTDEDTSQYLPTPDSAEYYLPPAPSPSQTAGPTPLPVPLTGRAPASATADTSLTPGDVPLSAFTPGVDNDDTSAAFPLQDAPVSSTLPDMSLRDVIRANAQRIRRLEARMSTINQQFGTVGQTGTVANSPALNAVQLRVARRLTQLKQANADIQGQLESLENTPVSTSSAQTLPATTPTPVEGHAVPSPAEQKGVSGAHGARSPLSRFVLWLFRVAGGLARGMLRVVRYGAGARESGGNYGLRRVLLGTVIGLMVFVGRRWAAQRYSRKRSFWLYA